MFYILGKMLKTAELQRIPKGDEFMGEILLFWISLVGIWILRPRINKLVEGEVE